jgi:hypothetical protein
MKIGKIEIPDENIKSFSVTVHNNINEMYNSRTGERHIFCPYREISTEIETKDGSIYKDFTRLDNKIIEK